MFDVLFNSLINLLLVPLQLILAPVDLLLAQIPNIEFIPQSIGYFVKMVGSFPSLLVYLFGIEPIIWNFFVSIVVVKLTYLPSINMLKRLLKWIRG